MTKRRFYKTKITMEVLSEDEPYRYTGLTNLAYDIHQGHYSGAVVQECNSIMNGLGAAIELQKQGSSPEFFRLDNNGNDLEEDSWAV